MQGQLQLITRAVEGKLVDQRVLDGYVNATAMCKAVGRPWSRYWENPTSKEFAKELSAVLGIPITELIQSLTGGIPEHQGTWVHPQVAIHLGQWLSPRFAVMVSGWVHEWMTGGATRAPMPYHLRRYGLNRGSVPLGHFSVFNEMILAIVGPMEEAGYTLPDRLVPDISEGRMFSQWLKFKWELMSSHFPPTRTDMKTDDLSKHAHIRTGFWQISALIFIKSGYHNALQFISRNVIFKH